MLFLLKKYLGFKLGMVFIYFHLPHCELHTRFIKNIADYWKDSRYDLVIRLLHVVNVSLNVSLDDYHQMLKYGPSEPPAYELTFKSLWLSLRGLITQFNVDWSIYFRTWGISLRFTHIETQIDLMKMSIILYKQFLEREMNKLRLKLQNAAKEICKAQGSERCFDKMNIPC